MPFNGQIISRRRQHEMESNVKDQFFFFFFKYRIKMKIISNFNGKKRTLLEYLLFR